MRSIREDNDSGTFNTIDTISADQTSSPDTTATPGLRDYTYQVIAIDSAGVVPIRAIRPPWRACRSAWWQHKTVRWWMALTTFSQSAGPVMTHTRLTIYYTLAGTAVPGPQDAPLNASLPAIRTTARALAGPSGSSLYQITIPAGQASVELDLVPLG